MSCPECHKYAIEACDRLVKAFKDRLDSQPPPALYMDEQLKKANDSLLADNSRLREIIWAIGPWVSASLCKSSCQEYVEVAEKLLEISVEEDIARKKGNSSC